MSPTDELTEYNLTPKDVAEMFKVNERTIRRWANDGTLPSRPRPLDEQGRPKTRHIMFRLSDIEQALREAGQTVPESGRGGMSGPDLAAAALAADEGIAEL